MYNCDCFSKREHCWCAAEYDTDGEGTGQGGTHCQLLGNWKLVVCCFSGNVFDICLKFIIQKHVHKHTSRVRDGAQTGCAIEKHNTTKQCLDKQIHLGWPLLFGFFYIYGHGDLYLINMHCIIKQHQVCV